MGEVVRAVPDGYTLLIGGFGGQIIPPLMKDDFPFDVAPRHRQDRAVSRVRPTCWW